jgi:hypothetical protein
MTDKEILVETEDGSAGIRYIPNGGKSKDGQSDLPEGTVEIFTDGDVHFTQTEDECSLRLETKHD